jgi:hypothetical protein
VTTRPAERSDTGTGYAYSSQADFPEVSLQEAQRIAAALADNFAAGGALPPAVAVAINLSPSSRTWRTVCDAAIAYGLTVGGPNAPAIRLTELGRRLVAPEADGEDVAARREAVLRPRIMRAFFHHYRFGKFPNEESALNFLRTFAIPSDRGPKAVEILLANGRYAGIVSDTPTGTLMNLHGPFVPLRKRLRALLSKLFALHK